MNSERDAPLRAALTQVRPLCAKLPGSEEYVMVHHPAFRVGKRPFLIVGMDAAAKGVGVSINLGRDMQEGLLADGRFTRTPYIGQHGWVSITLATLHTGELSALLIASWERVATKAQRARHQDARP